MQKYRRLISADKRRLNFFYKLKNTLKITSMWIFIVIFIFMCLIFGIILFYNVIDDKNQDTVDNASGQISQAMSAQAETEDDITDSEKSELIADTKKEVNNTNDDDKNEIISKEMDNNYVFAQWNEICPRELTVVNKFNPLSDDFKVNTKLCRGKEIDVDVCDHLEQMITDARKDDIILWISSGYRSVELQTKLFQNQVSREQSKSVISQDEAEKKAQTVVALPRTSEHNTGFAVDFNGVQEDFYTKVEYKWLIDNAHKYGFIERYQKKWQDKTGVIYEPWHFRYVGIENALLIKESDLCLEEYVFKNLIKQ